MALWLIDSDNNRYDILKGNIPDGFPVDVKRNQVDLAFAHGAKDIGDQKIDVREINIDSYLNGLNGGFMRMLDDCGDNDTVTDWVESDDGGNPAQYTSLVKQGTYSMALLVDASASGNDYAIWLRTISSAWNLSAFSGDYLKIWVYISTLDYVATSNSLQFKIGTDGSNYHQWNWDKADLAAGWNQLTCDLDNPDSQTGTVNWSSIGIMEIRINEVASNTNDFTWYFDDMKIWRVSYQAEFDDLARQIGKQDLKFYKDVNRYINVKNMRLSRHTFIVGDASASAEIRLFCPDPFFYKDSLTTESTWTVTSSPDTNAYFNEGNIDVFPIIEITASADLSGGIELKNQTDGNALFSYEDSNFTSGKKLTVDCQEGTVDLDGTSTFRFFEGQFLRLLAGTNTFQYTGGNCSIVFKHRDRWL